MTLEGSRLRSSQVKRTATRRDRCEITLGRFDVNVSATGLQLASRDARRLAAGVIKLD